MTKSINLRSLSAQLIERVVDKGESLNTALPAAQKKLSDKDSALVQEICFGVLRTLPQLEALIGKLMERPLTGKQRVLHYLIMVGLYQLEYTRARPCRTGRNRRGRRSTEAHQYERLIKWRITPVSASAEELLATVQDGPQRYLHPGWLLKRLQHAWPEQWQQIVEANNLRPPMWLRVNRQHHDRDTWLAMLAESGRNAQPAVDVPDALRLDAPAPVSQLPGFDQGWVTVQDLSAQRCALLLEPQNGEQILDLCAAPGGKTTHILKSRLRPKLWPSTWMRSVLNA